MVLSLAALSLRSITKGIEDGTIRHPHLLYPKLRERVLETAIKEELTDHPNCLDLLTSVEFLNGMTTISAEAGSDYDLIFLERLVASLATNLPNGEMVGAGIKTMNLKIEDNAYESDFENEETYSDVISKVYDLIAHCPNTESMDLNLDKSGVSREYSWPLNENENSAYNRFMENLVELSVVLSDWEDIIDSDRLIINFKKLTTLKLKFCIFENDTWPKLLEKIPFVENLHLFNVNSNSNGLDWIVPSPLPNLKSLEVIGFAIFECNKAFVDNLMECPQLRQVHLKLDERSTDEESLVRLASMNIDLKIDVRIEAGNDAAKNAAIFDSSSRFKLVSIFNGNMESFELCVWRDWNAQFSTALEDVVKTCSNLTSFDIMQPRFRVNQAQVECSEEKKRFNAALIRFFGNPQRAQQLQGLRLIGNFDETVLSNVFENCLNLVRLKIYECAFLRDQHLIDWVSCGGGKLTDLIVVYCRSVTSQGIIPILARSAEGLLHYSYKLRQDNGGPTWGTVLENYCPNARKIDMHD